MNSVPDFSWDADRRAGVFLHISSLPNSFGIGNLGPCADAFLDFMENAGLSCWQICPLGPTGYGDSPYQSFSAFAGNIYFIDFEELANCSLLEMRMLDSLRALERGRCDFGSLWRIVPNILNSAYQAFKSGRGEAFGSVSQFKSFCSDNAYWLDDYALFSALKSKFLGRPWYEWPPEWRNSERAKKNKLNALDIDAECAVKFGQWVFFKQYASFKKRANARGVEIFGDIPIFLARDSADVWANPALFELDKNLNPRYVAGVAPDYFSASGQLWGNPLYDWKGNKKAVYAFWKRRIAATASTCDIIRFDHFRGFADYWSVPAGETNASNGKMRKGPGLDFFLFLKEHFPKQRFVAEDLGLLSKEAFKLRDALKIPSMAVLQFAFGDNSDNPYFPHNMRPDRVYYTGTHDNDTAVGWYNSAPENAKDQMRRYFRSPGNSPNWDMIHAVMMSVARLAIFPMQDILGLASDCRTNTPGKADGNWTWRLTSEQLSSAKALNAPYLKSLSELSGRLAKNSVEKAENNL